MIDPLELLALGMRMASGDRSSIPDELFRSAFVREVFASRAKAIQWLSRHGVEWDGKQESLIQAVADSLRVRNELVAARTLIDTARLKLTYTNLTEPSELKDIVSALLAAKLKATE